MSLIKPMLWVWIGSPDDNLDVLRYVKATEADIMGQPCVRTRIAELKAELERLREYVRSDAYCPCCGDHGPNHSHDCEYRDERMELAREVLYGEKESL